MVLVMSALSFLTRYPPASSGPWLRGVMACQGRNRRLVRDCPTSIDAQMERKVQRVEGVTGVRMRTPLLTPPAPLPIHPASRRLGGSAGSRLLRE